MKRYILTPRAARDVDEIWEHIAAHNIDAADRVLDRIYSALKMLADFPESGHFRLELADKRHRFHAVYSYLIVYRSGSRPIQILRILHGARDVRALLVRGGERD